MGWRRRNQLDDHPPHLRVLEAFELFAHADHDGRGLVSPRIGNRQHQTEQSLLNRVRQPANHAEVDERQAPIRRQQHVARMRIGVKKTIDQNLMEIGAK